MKEECIFNARNSLVFKRNKLALVKDDLIKQDDCKRITPSYTNNLIRRKWMMKTIRCIGRLTVFFITWANKYFFSSDSTALFAYHLPCPIHFVYFSNRSDTNHSKNENGLGSCFIFVGDDFNRRLLLETDTSYELDMAIIRQD